MSQIARSSGSVPRIDFTLPALSTQCANRFTVIDPRANANSFSDCFGSLAKIPDMIGLFFSHCWADARMFWRALNSMGNGTSSNDIDRRFQQLRTFRDLALTSNDRTAVATHFNRMPLSTRNLMYIVTENHMNDYRVNYSAERLEFLRDEIVREADTAMSFQSSLRMVNTFYRIFSGRCFDNGGGGAGGAGGPIGGRPDPGGSWPDPIIVDPVAPEPNGGGGVGDFNDDLQAWIDRMLGRIREPASGGGAVTRPTGGGGLARPDPRLNLNIPGTVAYTPNNIPQAIRANAQEIERLSDRFEHLRNPPAIPGIYGDSLASLRDFMLMPVFDASHPQVQAGMNAASSSSATSSAAVLAQRERRHYLDRDSMESVLNRPVGGGYWNGGCCPQCRHPAANTTMRRENMRIDTDLQNEILGFLRNAVNTAPANAFTAAATSVVRRT